MWAREPGADARAQLGALRDARLWYRAHRLPLIFQVFDQSTEPSGEWLRLWWSVDGRGGAEAMDVARGILTGCPALYALVRDDDRNPAAVGRLAVPGGGEGGWGGLYCMATRPDARRRGHATAVLHALLGEGTRLGLANYGLLVTAANTGARELYARAGFEESGRYLRRQERPKRHLTGC